MYLGLFKYSQHDQASRSRNLKNTTTVILLPKFLLQVDFPELRYCLPQSLLNVIHFLHLTLLIEALI